MFSHLSNRRPRKEVMSKNDFLTYKQDLTFVATGSREVAIPGAWKPYLEIIPKLRTAFRETALYAEMLFRELVISNLIVTLFFVYSLAAKVAFVESVRLAIAHISIGAFLKRSIDIFGSAIGLIVLSPMFALIAVAIKLDSEGPVFFLQERTGKNHRKTTRRTLDCDLLTERRLRDRRKKDLFGVSFNVYKFRSMIDNAEKKSGPIWASKNDPRITRVGSFLRKMRLDEFPQLINVLKGEMSLVGPRPERPMFVESLLKDISDYPKRLDVRPGITGLAQVSSGYDTSISSVREKVKHDLQYISNWNLLQDIKILLKTVVVMITGKGAF